VNPFRSTVAKPPYGKALSWLLLAGVTLLGACSHTPVAPPDAEGWQAQLLPGKRATQYVWTSKDGRPALHAESRQSASLWRKRITPGIDAPTDVRFSWWVQDVLSEASVADPSIEDAPARIVFGFDGDRSKLSGRNRMLFDLAETLTGEVPPYATLMYVWDAELPVGTVVISRRTDRIRKIVVDSGRSELRRWRDHRRNLRQDFERAFGEAPGPLMSVALMSDSDNTQSEAQAWYGPVRWEPSGKR
jgi:hypothetical protein